MRGMFYLCIIETKGGLNMKKRKYVLYQLVANYGEVNEEYDNYSEAFSKYQRQDTPKTLYGFDEQWNISVILSK